MSEAFKEWIRKSVVSLNPILDEEDVLMESGKHRAKAEQAYFHLQEAEKLIAAIHAEIVEGC